MFGDDVYASAGCALGFGCLCKAASRFQHCSSAIVEGFFSVFDSRSKFIIRFYVEFAMIGRTCPRFRRGHVFIVECCLLLCIHVHFFVFTCFTFRLVVRSILFDNVFFCRSSCASPACEGQLL